MIAAGVPEPHQKSSLLGPSLPAPRYCRLLSSCSSHPAGAGLWWLALSPPTLPGCSAGDGIGRMDGWWERNEEREEPDKGKQVKWSGERERKVHKLCTLISDFNTLNRGRYNPIYLCKKNTIRNLSSMCMRSVCV